MNSSISKYLFLVLTGFLSISIYGQKNVTKEKYNNITSTISDQKNTPSYASNMQIHNPHYELDQQIKQTLINDVKKRKVLMPVFNASSSILINPKRQLSLGEIAKKLKEDN